MSKTNTLENGFLRLFFLNEPFTGLGDAAGLLGSAVAGNVYISLHTADPGEGADQTTSEATYTGYARAAVARVTDWTVVADTASNLVKILFGACTAGANTITHVGIGTAASGAGKLCYKSALTASLAVSAGITPDIAIGELDIIEA